MDDVLSKQMSSLTVAVSPHLLESIQGTIEKANPKTEPTYRKTYC